jgi:DNA repair ATPase RecN
MASRLLGYEVQRLGIIKIFNIDISGRHVTKLTGANGQGKSTALKALEMLLNTKAVPKEPIQHGEERAQIIGKFETDKGEILVKKTFTKLSPRGKLQVSINGIWQKSPQSLLEELLGLISFNPLEFCEADPEEQKEMLLTVLGLADRIKEINTQYDSLYDARTDVLRDARKVRQTLDKVPKVEESLPINIIEVVEHRQRAAEHNLANDKVKEDLRRTTQKISDLENDKKLYQERLDSVRRQLQELLAMEEQLSKTVSEIESDHIVEVVKQGHLERQIAKLKYKDVSVYDQQLNQVEEHNLKAHYWQERQALEGELSIAKKENDHLVAEMSLLKEEKERLLQEASFPIPDLTFTDEGVRYKGTIVSDISKAQKLLVGCAVLAALNPTLRLVLMDDAEKLDSKSLKMIEDWATEHDLYVLMAMVEESGNVGIVFQDGEVISNEYQESKSK